MSQLVEQGENLARMGSAVIDDDERKHVIAQTQARDALLLERPLKNENPGILNGLSPRLECFIGTTPLELVAKVYAQVFPHTGAKPFDGFVRACPDIGGYQTGGRVPPLS